MKFRKGDRRTRELARRAGKASAAKAKARRRRAEAELPRIRDVLELVESPRWFGADFGGPSWAPWRAALKAAFALSMSAAELALYRAATGREAPPTTPCRELWAIVGRRGGKSRIAALLAVYLALRSDYRDVLVKGEKGVVSVLAADRRQCRVVLQYVRALLKATPDTAALIVADRVESIELAHRVRIEVYTTRIAAPRGYTLLGAICDEIAFWPTDEAGANPDSEILGALRPGMATVPGALLVVISSPYARRGELWKAFERHHGEVGDVLVWKAATETMNPAIDRGVIARAYTDDAIAAAAEYGAEFRRDVETFLDAEALHAVTVRGRRELPPAMDLEYHAFTDPSGGANDAFTLAIAHRDATGTVVLDATRIRRPPFSPDAVVEEFADVCTRYGARTVTGDRYAGEWPRERFRVHGVTYVPSARSKSDLYQALLPLVNAGRCELLDVPLLRAQLAALERRTARGGRDSIDHPPGAHDDLANAVAGVLVELDLRGVSPTLELLGVGDDAAERQEIRPEDLVDGWWAPVAGPRQLGAELTRWTPRDLLGGGDGL